MGVKREAIEKTAGSLVRHNIYNAGGILVALQVITEQQLVAFADSTTQIIVGVLAMVFAQGWSLVEKYAKL